MVDIQCGERRWGVGCERKVPLFGLYLTFLVSVVQLRIFSVSEFLFEKLLPAHVPNISTRELSAVVRSYSLTHRRHSIRAHISQHNSESVSGIGLTLGQVYSRVSGNCVLHLHHISITLQRLDTLRATEINNDPFLGLRYA